MTAKIINRRKLLAGLAAAAAPTLARAAAPISAFGIDAAQLGVRPGSPDDQTRALQRAIDQAAAAHAPLALAPGTYRAGDLILPAGAQIRGIRGETRLVSTGARPVFTAPQTNSVTISGLVIDGVGARLPERLGLISLMNGRAARVEDCALNASGGHGLSLDGVAGDILGCTIADAADVGIISFDAKGLTIARNIVRSAGNNGIQILRSLAGEDATMVVDNRIEDIRNVSGGTGQFGNGINAFRAHHVIVARNRIDRCAFSAVRGNSANDIEITGNSCSNLGEVALYSEFGFTGAVIAHNTVDGALIGVSVANFNKGGRIAVVQGNILRNLARHPGQTEAENGIGIYVEADTAVTGNVVENAEFAGIMAGWGPYLRDVTVMGNVVRTSPIGVGVSVVPGAGGAVIADNMITGARRGAILGMDHLEVISDDLAKTGAARYAQLAISGNQVN
ncbi:MAG TPA: TIGR03808 family TAT-translocated repetitive protein [Xanthobacteraceae bacterium]|nr:TIGR03808 family TAT-translocated repetitive protein [Xanthobacteraceae bacterium]